MRAKVLAWVMIVLNLALCWLVFGTNMMDMQNMTHAMQLMTGIMLLDAAMSLFMAYHQHH
ncbi:hypothetical protein [Lacticaseibacillus thailandensis]|uniref:Uncharacterized protein n=1 Tax=Lacticaseibacillus thailandensis DSM 22698 = JCM 13996 TaxID=1423810 RepID=A0A0R2CGL4_9LACO|nr:hypothetical protein [Lacticaseibacillus thailandensis]KRM87126.1 hypothetical protein FD19_GL001278 [Lacticaseibacillus thailandensis DSM 22698 = JCM 13996]